MSKKRREKNMRARMKSRSLRRHNTHTSQSLSPAADMPSFADIKAPNGFRPLSMTQALMEFAAPLTEHVESDELDDVNAVMQVAGSIWNQTLPKTITSTARDELVEDIATRLDIDERDADQLVDELTERKHYLFPADMQPDDPRWVFMRKTVEYQIEKFDEDRLGLADEPLSADREDLAMLDALRRLDTSLGQGDAYDDWESLYFEVEKACYEQYFRWLTVKGVPEKQCREFPFCIETFLNFVYRYSGSSVLQISDFDLEEFLLDHLPRKVVIQPNDYVFWPPAMRLLYRFLLEKGYGQGAERIMSTISSIEPDFIAMLQKQL